MYQGKTEAEWRQQAVNCEALARQAEDGVQPALTQEDREHWQRMAHHWWEQVIVAEDNAKAAKQQSAIWAADRQMVADMERDGLL